MKQKNRGFLYARTRDFWYVFKQNRLAVAGLILFLIFVFCALFASLAPYNPFQLGASSFMAPSWEHLLGTDDLGRDVFSGVLHGIRISLVIGLLAVVTSTGIGVIVGAISGFYGGIVDQVLMRIAEVFQVIPSFILSLVLISVVGQSIWYVILVIGVLSWPALARIVRAEFLSLKERMFVEAAVSLGENNSRIIQSEIMPNATSPIIVNVSLEMARAIVLEAGLSFLGVGDPNVMSLGYVLYNSKRFIYLAPWIAIASGLVLFFLTLSLNLVGDGLNAALNPRLRER